MNIIIDILSLSVAVVTMIYTIMMYYKNDKK